MPSFIRSDPLEAYRYFIEIDGVVAGGFSNVSGFSSGVKLYSYREGGNNEYAHHFPDAAEQSAITLQRGLTLDDSLWRWYQDVLRGSVRRKTVYVLLIGRDGWPSWLWGFTNAFPVKWVGPVFDAEKSAFAVESVELVYQEILNVVNRF